MAQALIHTMFQFFYQSVFNMGIKKPTGKQSILVSMLQIPDLEAKIANEVLDWYTLGPKYNDTYAPVPADQQRWF